MSSRSLVTTLAAGFAPRTKAAVGVTDFRGMLGAREPFTGAWQRNMELTPDGGLLSYAPIYACVSRISGDIAKLGLLLMEETDQAGVFEPAVKDSPYWPVLRKPNSFQNRIQFIRHWLLCKLLFGNAYALKQRDMRGIVTALYLLDPRRVTPLVTEDGGVYYGLGGDQLARIPIGLRAAPASEIIHDRGATLFHQLVGIPPIFACALSGTLGLKIQQNSANFFGNMSRPSGVLTVPGQIGEPEHAKLKDDWNNFKGSNIGRIAILQNGMKFEAMAVAAEQSQLAEQLGLSAVDVATAFGMPAYKINQGPMPTNNNVQALNQQYYSDCLQIPMEELELCLDEGLGVSPRYSVQFDLDGLLRMDSATQMDVLAKGVAGTVLSPDEARQKLNRRKVDGGSSPMAQHQMYSLEALSKRDAMDDPFGLAKPAPVAPAAESPPPAAPPADDKTVLLLLQKALDASERAAAAEERAMAAAKPIAPSDPPPDHAKAVEDVLTKAVEVFEAAAIKQRQADDEAREQVEQARAADLQKVQAMLDAITDAKAPPIAPAALPPPDEDIEKMADALIAGFDALEAAHG